MEKEEKELEQEIELLYEKLYEVNVDMSDCMEKIDEKNCKLERLRSNKLQAAMLRSKIKYYELGEKPTKYFFDLEKRNSVAKTITQLNIDNNIVTNPKEILKAQRDFYKNLYSPNHQMMM